MKINDITISAIHGDVTMLKVDAVVNAANTELTMERGLAVAIKNKGGDIVEEQARQKAPIKPGEAVWTNAGKIKANYVIHTATIEEYQKTNQVQLRDAAANALKVACSLKVKTLAMPALGCGAGKFNVVGAAKIMTQEIMKIARDPNNTIEEITFCIFDDAIFKEFFDTVQGYVKHVQENLGEPPYKTVDIIIETGDGIVLIERSNPPFGWALPGGFIDKGEEPMQAAIREAKEETNLDLEKVQEFNTYSDEGRDPRFHTISTVYTAKGIGEPKSGSDAQDLKVVKHDKLESLEYAFDHSQIIKEYLEKKGS